MADSGGFAIRRSQLERDIQRAVDRLLLEFYSETERSPHSVEVELSEKLGTLPKQFTVAAVQARFDD